LSRFAEPSRRARGVLAATLLSGLVCAASLFAAPGAVAAVLPSGFHDFIVLSHIDEPTNVRFAKDGEVFVSEKTGDILVYESLDDTAPEVFADLQEQVYDNGDRGLLGLELAPNFPEEPYVYALYTFNHVIGEQEPGEYPAWENENGSPVGDPCPAEATESPGVDACPVSGRLVRLTAEGEHAGEEKVLLEDWCQQDSSHSVGQIHFGPEGALYVSGGDGASFDNADYGQFGWPQPNQCGDPPGNIGMIEAGTSQALTPPTAQGGSLRAQDLRTPGDPTDLNGALLRINPETGEGLPENPLHASSDPNARRIIAYGFRNPFRFALDPTSGQVYVDNVGWNTAEEIDRFSMLPEHPYNSGWPCYEADERTEVFSQLGLSICEGLYDEPGSTSPPYYYYLHGAPITADEEECPTFNGSAISGVTPYRGEAFPEKYDGALFFSDSVRGCIYVMPPGNDGNPDPEAVEPFLTDGGLYPAIDIEEGPEGNLFYTQLYGGEYGPGAIHEISYGTGVPDARLTADKTYGNIPEEGLTITFDASESISDSGELEYDWDLDGNGTFETHGGKRRSVVYPPTAYEEDPRISVKVTDEVTHLSSIAELTVHPGDEPSEIRITEPSETATEGVGQEFHFAGEVIEFSSGNPLPPERLVWKTRLLHCPYSAELCHRHPLQTFEDTDEGNFTAPDHGYPSAIELTLTATDYRGLQTSKTITLNARPVPLQVVTDPPGIEISAGEETKSAPFTLMAIENSTVTVSAPQSVTSGGTTYTFGHWSDGGERIHSVHTDVPKEVVAYYTGGSTPPPSEGSVPPSSEGSAQKTNATEKIESSEKPASVATPSKPKIRSHPRARTTRRTARFVFRVAGQRGLKYSCRLDLRRFRRCRSPKVYRHLKAGAHVFRVRAAEPGGRPGKTRVFKWRVLPSRKAAKSAAQRRGEARLRLATEDHGRFVFVCPLLHTEPGSATAAWGD
jgi:glucose/arabinose dehydrogenase